MSDLYDKDTYTWALSQADALRRRSANEIDWENVAEEIESVGRSQESELYSRFSVLLMHLLKWAYQPQMRSRSWSATVRTQRKAIKRVIRKNPGLQPVLGETFADSYENARIDAAAETNLPEEAFPEGPPFSVEQSMDEDFWPEAPAAE